MPCVTAMHTRWNVLAEQFHTITTILIHARLHSTKHVSRATLHNFNASNSMHTHKYTHTWAPPFYFVFVENGHYTNLLLTALFSNTVQQTIHNSLSTYNHQQLCNSEAHCLHDANRRNVAVSLMQSIWTMMLELRHWRFHSMHTYKLLSLDHFYRWYTLCSQDRMQQSCRTDLNWQKLLHYRAECTKSCKTDHREHTTCWNRKMKFWFKKSRHPKMKHFKTHAAPSLPPFWMPSDRAHE